MTQQRNRGNLVRLLIIRFIYLFGHAAWHDKLHDMRSCSHQGLNLCSLHWKRGVSTTGLSGKSNKSYFKACSKCVQISLVLMKIWSI